MFRDRKDAGQQLGIALSKYRRLENVIVLGIARGGVETAYYVAQYLESQFDVVITRKLGFPDDPEIAFGAICEDGSVYFIKNAESIVAAEITDEIIEEQRHEIARRVKTFRNGKPLADLKNKIVIIADDGIATGATIMATILMCKKQKAAKIIVGAPIAGTEICNMLDREVNEMLILEKTDNLFAVSQAYKYFYNLSDQEVIEIIKKWENNKRSGPDN